MTIKICAISTIDGTMTSFIIPAMRLLKDQGYDVTLMCNMSDRFYEKYSQEFHCINVPMKRGMSLKDVIMMPLFFKSIFKREFFDCVQYATPNASFYASLGAKWTNIPKRVYCQWGIRYVGNSGLSRMALKILEKLICNNSTHIRPASWKNLDFAVAEGLYKRNKASVIGDGGTIGIDLKQFDITTKQALKDAALIQYPQLKDKIVFCFVGRINKDKGVFELLDAFLALEKKYNEVALVFVGSMDGIRTKKIKRVRSNDNIIFTGYTKEVSKYMAVSDVLVHPSHREGFSMVIQQAMAMELPVVTTDIPGPSEVIVKNVTGLLAKPNDVETLYNAMLWMLNNPERRREMGKAGRKRCEEKFSRERMLKLTLADRNNILNRQ